MQFDSQDITSNQKAFLEKNNIPFPLDCDKVTAGKLISDYLQSIPATKKQTNYLRSMGYCGEIDKLSFARASGEIERLYLKKIKERVPF